MTTFVEMVEVPMHGYSEPVLVGKDQESRQNISKCRKGVVYRVVPKRHNNVKFQRMVERMVRDLYENQDYFKTEAAHREALKIKIGWVEDRLPINKQGDMQWITKPLDFASCGQDEREQFLEMLKPYYGERMGWDALAAYEGGL